MPPKVKPLKSPDPPFLFVNEYAGTIDGSGKADVLDRSKQSHVQRQSFARRKRQKEREAATRAMSTSGDKANVASLSGSSKHLYRSRTLSTGAVPAIFAPGTETPSFFVFESQGIASSSSLTQLISPSSLHKQPSFSPSWSSQDAFSQDNAYLPGHFFDSPSMVPQGLSHSPQSEPSNFHHNLSPTISNLTISDDLNPLINTRLALELWAPPLMQYYTSKILTQVFHTDLEARPLALMRHAQAVHVDLQTCMGNPAHMYAFLASASAHMLYENGYLNLPNLPQGQSERIPLLFKTKAIEALRPSLARGQVNKNLVIAVHRLMTASLFQGDLSAAEAHYGAVLSMINTIGGLGAFNDYEKEWLTAIDLCYTMRVDEKPRLEIVWDRDLISDQSIPLMLAEPSSSTLKESRFQMIFAEVDQGFIDPVLAVVTLDVVRVLRFRRWLRKQESYRASGYCRLVQSQLTVTSQLLNMSYHSLVSGETSGIDLPWQYQYCLRYALLFCMLPLSLKLDGQSYLAKHLGDYIGTLALYSASMSWDLHASLRLWMIVIGGISISTCEAVDDSTLLLHTVTQKARDQILDDGKALCIAINIGSVSSLEDMMRSFLFCDNWMDGRFQTFAQTGLDLRDGEEADLVM